MSKMDNLRALRETRYAQAAAPATRTTVARRPTVGATPRPVEPADEPTDEGLCGHRAISGRTCTRERGHAAKSHRYA